MTDGAESGAFVHQPQLIRPGRYLNPRPHARTLSEHYCAVFRMRSARQSTVQWKHVATVGMVITCAGAGACAGDPVTTYYSDSCVACQLSTTVPSPAWLGYRWVLSIYTHLYYTVCVHSLSL